MKDHEIAQLHNDLRDTAKKFHNHGCLREKMVQVVKPLVSELAAVMDIDQISKRLTADIFGCGDEPNSPCNRIQFMGGSWAANNEREQGGLGKGPLEKLIRKRLEHYFAENSTGDSVKIENPNGTVTELVLLADDSPRCCGDCDMPITECDCN